MKKFEYTITDPAGIHAWPGGLRDTITFIVDGGDEEANAAAIGGKRTCQKVMAELDKEGVPYRQDIEIGICGKLRSDLSLLETFLAIGIDELSVSPTSVLPLRAELRKSIAKTCTLEHLKC